MAKKKSSSRAHRTPRAVLRLPNQVGGSEQPKLDGCAARIPQRLWHAPEVDQLRGKRDRARLAVLLACGVRRHEAVDLEFGRGTLGDRRPEGQSRPYADDSEAQLGESACGRLAPSSQPDHR